MKNLKTPLRYPGGKSRAITKISEFFPDLSKYEQFREPFLGGGSVSLWVTKTYPDLKIWVNDLYEPLYNFWVQLQTNGSEMQDILSDIKAENPDPDKAKELFIECKNQVSTGDDLDRAVAFYIINKCSFSGLGENSSFSAQASDSNFSMNGIEKLSGYQNIIKNWAITNLSYEHMLDGKLLQLPHGLVKIINRRLDSGGIRLVGLDRVGEREIGRSQPCFKRLLARRELAFNDCKALLLCVGELEVLVDQVM